MGAKKQPVWREVYNHWSEDADKIRHPPAKAQFLTKIDICHGSSGTK